MRSRIQQWRLHFQLRNALRARFPGCAVRFRQDHVVCLWRDQVVSAGMSRLAQIATEREERLPMELAHMAAECARAFDRHDAPQGEWTPALVTTERAERMDGRRRVTMRLASTLDVGLRAENDAWLTDEALARAGRGADALFATAVRALARGAVPPHTDTRGVRRFDGPGASSQLLLHDRWALDDVLCAPCVNTLFVVDRRDPAAIARMVDVAHSLWYLRTHALSARLWHWDDGHLRPWDLHA